MAAVVLLKLILSKLLGDLQAACVKANPVPRNDKMSSIQFPYLSLEDKPTFLAAGSDRTLVACDIISNSDYTNWMKIKYWHLCEGEVHT